MFTQVRDVFQKLSDDLLKDTSIDGSNHKLRLIEAAEEMFRKDVQTNLEIGKHGAEFILRDKQDDKKVNETNRQDSFRPLFKRCCLL